MKTETHPIESLRRRREDRRCPEHAFRSAREGRVLEWAICQRCDEVAIREKRIASPLDWSAEDREIAAAWYREMASRTLHRARMAS